MLWKKYTMWFRKGRGCVDMTFVARQLIEKPREHNSSFNIRYVHGFEESLDSVPRLALWQVLGKYGIPPTLIAIIKSLHE
jgi:hypothetical protein